MDLKSAGLCLILAIIIENAHGRHLSGGGFPSITGRRRFSLPRSLAEFGTGIPSFEETRFQPRRIRRVARFPDLRPSAPDPFGISSFRSQIGDSRPSFRSFGGPSDLTPIDRSQFERLSTRLSPSGPTVRRLRIPGLTPRTGQRLPAYFIDGSQSRPFLRDLSVTSGLASQLRHRFGRYSGSGTRDDPIRIPASLPTGSLGTVRGARPQLRQGTLQPVQRVSRQQSRRVHLSRARQPAQSRPQEVIALFGFDQTSNGNNGPPVLSETIDRQVQVQRTPIKKTSKTTPSTALTSSKTSERKITKTGGSSDLLAGSNLEHLSLQQLEKIVNEGSALVPDTQTKKLQTVDIKQETILKTGLSSIGDVISHSETTQTSQLTQKHKKTSEVKKAESPLKTDIAAESFIKAGAETSVKSVVADADTVNINVNANSNNTANNAANAAIDNSVTSAHSVTKSLSDKVTVDPKGISVISGESSLTDSGVLVSKKLTDTVSTVEGIAQMEIAPSSEIIVPTETASSAEIVIPVETVSSAETVVPMETVSSAEIVVPLETVPLAETVVPVETAHASEVAVTGESVLLTEEIGPVDTIPVADAVVQTEVTPVDTIKAEIIPLDTMQKDAIPVDTEVQTEVIPVETVAQSEAVPTETVLQPEVIPVDTVVQTEAIPEEMVANTEAIPVDTVVQTEVIPVDTVVQTEAIPEEMVAKTEVIPVEMVVRTEVIPVDTVVQTEAIPEETVAKTEVIPVEMVAKTEVIPVDTVMQTEVIPAEAVSQLETLTLKAEAKTASDALLINNSVTVTSETQTSGSKHVVSTETHL